MSQEKLSYTNFADYDPKDLFIKISKIHLNQVAELKKTEPDTTPVVDDPQRFYKTALIALGFITLWTVLIWVVTDNAALSITLGSVAGVMSYALPAQRFRYMREEKRLEEISAKAAKQKKYLEILETTLIEKVVGVIVPRPEDLNVLDSSGTFRVIDQELNFHDMTVKRESGSFVNESKTTLGDEVAHELFSFEYTAVVDDGTPSGAMIFNAKSVIEGDEILSDTASGAKLRIVESDEINEIEKRFMNLVQDLDIDDDEIMDEFSDLDSAVPVSPEESEAVSEFLWERFPEKMRQAQKEAQEYFSKLDSPEGEEASVSLSFSEEEAEAIRNFLKEFREQNNE